MEDSKPKLGIAIMPEPEFLSASLPLFEEAQIEVIEWSFDTAKDSTIEPSWLSLILKEYGDNNRLLGHGVYYSLLDANWTSRQDDWLKKVKQETSLYNYNHISEHFGFMSSQNAHEGFPLPFKLSNNLLKIGIDRLKRLKNTAKIAVGIENLALASNSVDILNQGDFIYNLVTPVNGFIILDLHNIYCQSENFKMDMMTIIKSYPLSLVKEIHISGGSWDNDPTLTQKIRRDTHDGSIPNKILTILPEVLKICPHLEYIIFERIGTSFLNTNDEIEFRNDFKKIRKIIDTTNFKTTFKNWNQKEDIKTLKSPLIDKKLIEKQTQLLKNLKQKNSNKDAEWNENMWKTATKLYKKWN